MSDMGVLIRTFIDRRVWAVVGVSRDPSKYGNRIFHTLLEAGYKVYPVNPNVSEIEGHRVFPALADLPEPPEVVDIVVPPKITELIVQECAQLGLKRVWMQPGSESEKAIDFCHQRGIEVVYGVCAMVHRKKW
jgi:predicted CoA-binding protein